MEKGQFAILRFAKYKGPEIGRIEAHNERTKEEYASNPDIDTSRSHLNFHLVKPERKYRAESERQIAAAGCRTRSDSVRVVEALITASPEFFKGKKRADIKEFFNEALEFIRQNQSPETIISAVVHMDEKTPHMHLSFVPLTEDKRLCAKEILGNRKKMTQWQDKFWEHMVRKYPVADWNKDEWSGFADLLANLIEKYAAVLDIDNLPEPPNCLEKETAGAANVPEQTEDTIEKTKTA